MSLKNCPRCGQVYNQVEGARDLCPNCVKTEDDEYRAIFKYLSSRPSASAQEIAEASGVDIKEIFRFVRENRLRIVKVESDIYCDSCGAPILIGKYCDKCQARLKKEIQIDLDKLKRNINDKNKPSDKTSRVSKKISKPTRNRK